MRPLVVLLMGLFLALALAADNRPRQGIIFDKPYVDLGVVKTSATLDQVFSFKVVGASPATIVEMRPSCGCVKPVLEKKTFQPGERGAIRLGVHAASQPSGPKRFELSLTVRDPLERSIILVIDADLRSDLVITPSNLILYPNGKDPHRQVIEIADKRPAPLGISSIESSSPRVRSKILDSTDPQVRRVELWIAADYPVGRSEEKVVLVTTDPEYKAIEIPILIHRQDRIRALPDPLRLRMPIEAGAEVRGLVVLHDAEGSDVAIVKAATDVPGVDCVWQRQPAPRPRISILLDSKKIQPPIRGHVTIQLSRPIATTLRIPLEIDR